MSSSYGNTDIYSVDGDDGTIDAICAGCDALWASPNVTFTVEGECGTLYTGTHPSTADDVYTGTTGEDRFYGIIAEAGVKSITLSSGTGALEVDHLQYGRP